MEFFMENFETTKVKALSRVKLLTFVLFLLILLGVYVEWQRMNKPLAEAIVVYKVTDEAVVNNKVDNTEGGLTTEDKKDDKDDAIDAEYEEK